MDYFSAQAKLAGRVERKIGNNRYLEQTGEGTICLRLHHTYIVVFYANGDIKLNSGGWRTVTTKAAINEVSPRRVNQVKGEWYVGDREFFDGMIIHA